MHYTMKRCGGAGERGEMRGGGGGGGERKHTHTQTEGEGENVLLFLFSNYRNDYH